MSPRLAITAACTPQFDWALELACDQDGSGAIDVRLEDAAVGSAPLLARELRDRAGRPLEMRFHFPVGTYDFAAHDTDEGLRGFLGVVDAIDGVAACGGEFMTIHLALPFEDMSRRLPLARRRLRDLVAHASGRGVNLCLENLRWGVTSDPDIFLDLVEASGCGVTFDVGHANSSDTAQRGFGSEEFARLVSRHVRNAHVYDREDPHHIAPEDLSRIEPTLHALLESACDWWVIELFDRAEVAHTRSLLRAFLGEHATTSAQESA